MGWDESMLTNDVGLYDYQNKSPNHKFVDITRVFVSKILSA